MIKKIFREYLATIILSLVLITLNIFVISLVNVVGISMEPTLTHKQFLYQLKLETIERFDIITFKVPDNKIFIKRVIGLPGDLVVYNDGKLNVNNHDYDEDYILEVFQGNHEFTVPDACYFVLGDNRNNSIDSRQLSFIPRSNILGVVHPFFDN